MAAILQSANILANNSQMYQNANARIFDAITNAANAYEEGQRRKAAILEAERKRQADAAAAQQAIALDPEKVTMQVLTKAQQDPASVTPQERAMFDAAQKTMAAKVAINPLTQTAYSPYSPISLGGNPADVMAPMPQTPVVQEQELPTSPIASMMDMPLMPNVSGDLLPLPAALKAGEERMDMTAPAPIGQGEIKTPEQIKPSAEFKPSFSDTGMSETPAGRMKRYEAELKFYSDKLLKDYEKGFDEETNQKSKGVVEQGLQRLKELNENLKEKKAIISPDTSLIGNVSISARNAFGIPIAKDLAQQAEATLDPEVSKTRQEFNNTLNMLFPFYAKASGLSATAIDTEAARQAIMKSLGDSFGNYETNLNQLKSLSNMIGTGYTAKKVDQTFQNMELKNTKLNKADPRVQQALKAGYTEEQVKAFLNGRK